MLIQQQKIMAGNKKGTQNTDVYTDNISAYADGEAGTTDNEQNDRR